MDNMNVSVGMKKKYKARRGSRWSNIEAIEIADVMHRISQNTESWLSADYRIKSGLWGLVANCFYSRTVLSDRLYLRNWYKKPHSSLKACLFNILGISIGTLSPPLRSSTPNPHRELHCICNGSEAGDMVECDSCKIWYHTSCIRQNIVKLRKQPTYMCPKCEGNSYIRFPSLCLESVVGPPLNISSIPPEDACNLDIPSDESFADSSVRAKDTHISLSESDDKFAVPPLNKSCIGSEESANPAVRSHGSSAEAMDLDFDSALVSLVSANVNKGNFQVKPQTTSHNSFFITKGCSSDDDALDDFQLKPGRRPARIPSTHADERNACGNDSSDGRGNSHVVSCTDPASWLYASYTDFDAFVRVRTNEETVDVPKKFSFLMPTAIFESYKTSKSQKSGAERTVMKKGWLCRIRDEFKPFNSSCVFNFRGQDVLHGRSNKIYDATGYCSHSGCWKIIKVFGYKHSQKNILFRVECRGTMNHEPYAVKRNRIQAEKRQTLQNQMLHRLPGRIATEVAATSTSFATKCGNYTDVPLGQVCRQAKHEVLKAQDLDKSPVVDLVRRLERDSSLAEYVQGYSIKPFSVTLFCDDQLRILRALHDTKKKIILHVDATGGIVQNLGKNLGDSQILLYAIVVENPRKGAGPIAVGEFLSNVQDTAAISEGLSRFFNSAIHYLRLPPTMWLKRIEVDFSLATIAAAIQNCWPCMTTKTYLIMCWEEIFGRRDPSSINLHVCRSHNIRTLNSRLDKCYGKDYEGKHVLMDLLRKYLHGNDIYKITFYIRKLFRLCTFKKYSDLIKTDVTTARFSAPTNFKSENPIDYALYLGKNMELETTPEGTSFGKFFHDVLDSTRREAQLHDLDASYPDNPFYNECFVAYMLKYILPYTPVHTHVMCPIRSDDVMRDDQSPVELWNKEVKAVRRKQKMKLPRYVQEAVAFIKGKCTRFVADLVYQVGFEKNINHKRKKNAIPNASDLLSLSLGPTMKTEVSTEDLQSFEFKEGWKKPGSAVARRSYGSSLLQTLPFIEWGTLASDTGDYLFRNTCTIDNTLAILCYLHESDHRFLASLDCDTPSHTILKSCLDAIFAGETNKGKQIWLVHFTDKNLLPRPVVNNLEWDEFEYAVKPLAFLFDNYKHRRHCTACNNCTTESYCPILNTVFSITDEVERLNTGEIEAKIKCPVCNNEVISSYANPDSGPPSFFVLHLATAVWTTGTTKATSTRMEDIPVRVCILGHDYELMACSLFQEDNNHFVCVIMFQKQWFTYDGLDHHRKFKKGQPGYKSVSNVWYRRIYT